MLDLVPLNPFGRLVAIRPVRIVDGTKWVWLCRCSMRLGGCGGVCEVRSALLRSGGTKSCGCLRRQRASIIGRQTQKPFAEVKEMIRLRKLGFTYRVLAKFFKVSEGRCYRLLKLNGCIIKVK